MSLFNWFKARRAASRRSALSLDVLEARDVPSFSHILDLTHEGATKTANGALFQQLDTSGAPTDLDTFLQIGNNCWFGDEKGYNSDARPVQFNASRDPELNHSLPLDSVPLVTINGTQYREFVLDADQWRWAPYLSLEELRVYSSNDPNLHGYNSWSGTLGGVQPIYNLDAGRNNTVILNANLNRGSAAGDMVLNIPANLFTGGAYVSLYSKFGGFCVWANGGPEQWGVRPTEPQGEASSVSGAINGPAGADYDTFVVHITVNGVEYTAGLVSTGDGTFGYEIDGILLDGATTATVQIIDQFGGELMISVDGSDPDSVATVTLAPGETALDITITFE